jgi:hypothetical protein
MVDGARSFLDDGCGVLQLPALADSRDRSLVMNFIASW